MTNQDKTDGNLTRILARVTRQYHEVQRLARYFRAYDELLEECCDNLRSYKNLTVERFAEIVNLSMDAESAINNANYAPATVACFLSKWGYKDE